MGSEMDGGVDPMHVRKMAARLQASTSSDLAERPILLWIEHANDPSPPEAHALQAMVDQRVFLMWQLGMPMGRP
jgi:hypothetical protein